MKVVVSAVVVGILVLTCCVSVEEGSMCEEKCESGWVCRTFEDPIGYSPTFSACEPE